MQTMPTLLKLVLIAAAAATASAAAPIPAQESGPCDPLVPSKCYLPWPNDYWRTPGDADVGQAPSLNLTGTIPRGALGMVVDPEAGGWNALDGFSPLTAAVSYVANVSLSRTPGVARLWNVGDSVLAGSPTVLLDTVTGLRVPHFVELDHRSDDKHPAGYARALMMWPAATLVHGRRYVWAYRGLRTAPAGALAPPASPAFVALRDGAPHPGVSAARRARFADEVFGPLARAGVANATLQLAWDFTVGSRAATQDRLLSMRDDALRRGVPEFTVTSVQDNYTEHMYRKVHGTFQVPLYLRSAKAGQDARLVLSPETGLPVYQGRASANFTVLVPRTAVGADGRAHGNSSLLQYGHGLFGSQNEMHAGYLQAEANAYGRVLVGVDWWGLCHTDVLPVAAVLTSNLTNFGIVPDRLQQGVVNHHMVMLMVAAGLSRDPSMHVGGAPVLPQDPAAVRTSYAGNSLGGIMGTTYVATSGSTADGASGLPNVTRGCLGVNGGPFSQLLPRSVDFSELWTAMNTAVYPDPTDIIWSLNLLQALWDRAGPGGWMAYAGSNPPPGTQPHAVLQQYGVGDAQVTYLGAYSMARSVGARMFEPNVGEGNQTLYGFERVPGTANVTDGRSVIQGYSFEGVPPVPQINVPPQKSTDTHECVRRAPQAQLQMARFFDQGVITNFCPGAGKCASLPCPHRKRAPAAWKAAFAEAAAQAASRA